MLRLQPGSSSTAVAKRAGASSRKRASQGRSSGARAALAGIERPERLLDVRGPPHEEAVGSRGAVDSHDRLLDPPGPFHLQTATVRGRRSGRRPSSAARAGRCASRAPTRSAPAPPSTQAVLGRCSTGSRRSLDVALQQARQQQSAQILLLVASEQRLDVEVELLRGGAHPQGLLALQPPRRRPRRPRAPRRTASRAGGAAASGPGPAPAASSRESPG